MVILIEMYKTLPVLWTFEIQRWKYKVSNKSEWQAVSQAVRLQMMFKGSSLFSSACPKTWTPLLGGRVDDLLSLIR